MNPDKYLEDLYEEERQQEYDYWKEKYNGNPEKDGHEFDWLNDFVGTDNAGWYDGNLIIKLYHNSISTKWFMKYFRHYAYLYSLDNYFNSCSNPTSSVITGDAIYVIFDKDIFYRDLKQLESVCLKDRYTIKELDIYDNFIYEED